MGTGFIIGTTHMCFVPVTKAGDADAFLLLEVDTVVL